MRYYKFSSAWLVVKICYMPLRMRKWDFSPKCIAEARNHPEVTNYHVFDTNVPFTYHLLWINLTTKRLGWHLWYFLFFSEIYDLGGRGSISATGTTKIKLWTWNLEYNTPKHCSFMKLYQKSAKHHRFDFTKTGMQFSPRKWTYAQIMHSWRQGSQFQIHPNLFFVWGYIRLYEKGKETYLSSF